MKNLVLVLVILCSLLLSKSEAQRTWQQVSSNACYSLAVSGDGKNLFAGTNCGIYTSSGNGAIWNPTRIDSPTYAYGGLVTSGKNLFGVTYNYDVNSWSNVSLSTDNGKNWILVSSGLPNSRIYALSASGTNLFAGTDSGVYRSSNQGLIWKQCLVTGTAVYPSQPADRKLPPEPFLAECSCLTIMEQIGSHWVQRLRREIVLFGGASVLLHLQATASLSE